MTTSCADSPCSQQGFPVPVGPRMWCSGTKHQFISGQRLPTQSKSSTTEPTTGWWRATRVGRSGCTTAWYTHTHTHVRAHTFTSVVFHIPSSTPRPVTPHIHKPHAQVGRRIPPVVARAMLVLYGQPGQALEIRHMNTIQQPDGVSCGYICLAICYMMYQDWTPERICRWQPDFDMLPFWVLQMFDTGEILPPPGEELTLEEHASSRTGWSGPFEQVEVLDAALWEDQRQRRRSTRRRRATILGEGMVLTEQRLRIRKTK